MKCEPAAYTIDDLARDGRTSWEGVRNYQARNFMRDEMREGDPVLFYASNAEPSGVAGLAVIARGGYPDHFAWKTGHKYFDEAGSADVPVWYMVDIAFVERFPAIVSLDTLKKTPGLEQMMVTQKGSRLSVQPVTPAEYDIVVKLGRAAKPAEEGGGAVTKQARRPATRTVRR
jgi:predicted RNA-binding protein with PUA-like domain